MRRKNEVILTQEEIDRLVKEKTDEYFKKHTAWIRLKYGNTYVGFDVCDIITEKLICRIRTLFELMGVKYSISYPFDIDKSYYFIIDGEDKARAEFIQKFIDNGYKLSW